jgi:hypothetical protein
MVVIKKIISCILKADNTAMFDFIYHHVDDKDDFLLFVVNNSFKLKPIKILSNIFSSKQTESLKKQVNIFIFESLIVNNLDIFNIIFKNNIKDINITSALFVSNSINKNKNGINDNKIFKILMNNYTFSDFCGVLIKKEIYTFDALNNIIKLVPENYIQNLSDELLELNKQFPRIFSMYEKKLIANNISNSTVKNKVKQKSKI